jgi:hypothetical protein
MTGFAHGRMQAPGDPQTYDFGSARAFDEFEAGEPIYPPRERGSSMLSAALVLLVLFGGGWAFTQAPADWLERLGAQVATLSALVHGSLSPSSAPPAIAPDPTRLATPTPVAAAAPMPPVVEEKPMAQNEPATPPDAVAVETGTVQPAETAEAAPEKPQPLPPLRIDPGDPYQKKAVAVGLHPDLSRVVLKQLTAADYRNAAQAIDAAVAKTADDDNFVWPRQRKPEQALFRVHFVPGAAPQCRRYVVTIVKNGWSTTALPMERCGAQLRAKPPKPEQAAATGRR